MTYTPNPADPTNPNAGISAGTANSEFVAIKNYIQQIFGRFNFRNKLLNGDFKVSQLPSTLVIAPSGSSGATPYVIDAWFFNNLSASGNITFNSVGTSLTSNSAIVSFTFDANATAGNFSQRVEPSRVSELISGTTLILSGFIEVDSLATTPVITYTLLGENAFNNFSAETQIATGTIAITFVAGNYVYFQQQIVLTGSAQNGLHLALGITNGTNRTITFSKIQLETNFFQTPYEEKFYPHSLLELQRYYQTNFFYSSIYWSQGAAATYYQFIPFTTPMYKVPNIAFTNTESTLAGVTFTASAITNYGFILCVNIPAFTGELVVGLTWYANAQI